MSLCMGKRSRVKYFSLYSSGEYRTICTLYQLYSRKRSHLHNSANQQSDHSFCPTYSAAGSQSGCRVQSGGRAAHHILHHDWSRYRVKTLVFSLAFS